MSFSTISIISSQTTLLEGGRGGEGGGNRETVGAAQSFS